MSQKGMALKFWKLGILLALITLPLAVGKWSEKGSHRRGIASIETDSPIEIFSDTSFQTGFLVRTPTPGSGQYTGTLQAAEQKGKAPEYGIAQWYSHSDISTVEPTVLPSGATQWKDRYKEIVYGPVGTPEEGITLGVNSIEEYGGIFRDGNTKDWPHLYFEQEIGTKRSTPSLKEISSLRLSGSMKLLKADLRTGAGYNFQIHTAQYVVYFLVQNLNRQSPGYGNDFINFGFIPYDSRNQFSPPLVFPDPDGGHLIYQIGFDSLSSTSMKSKEWVKFDRDIYPDVMQAWKTAIAKGVFKSKDPADYFIGSMNVGWEVPGLADVSIISKKLKLDAKTWANPPRFDFDLGTLEGWIPHCGDLNRYQIISGYVMLKTKPNQFCRFVRENLNIQADRFKKVKIRIAAKKSEGRGKGLMITWTKKWESPPVGGNQKFEIKYDGQWRDYVIDLSNHALWSGSIGSFSVVYGVRGTRAKVAIDSIEFVE